MSLQNKFFKFHDAILLGIKDVAYNNARLKDDSILKDIKARFKEDGFPVIDDFIQGSMATDTGIRENGQDFDIDRAIVIEASLAPENPITPKKAVLEVLEARGFKNAKIKKPCVTADYKTEDLHIDIPIYRRYENGQYELAVLFMLLKSTTSIVASFDTSNAGEISLSVKMFVAKFIRLASL